MFFSSFAGYRDYGTCLFVRDIGIVSQAKYAMDKALNKNED
jgi:hypothetical protein